MITSYWHWPMEIVFKWPTRWSVVLRCRTWPTPHRLRCHVLALSTYPMWYSAEYRCCRLDSRLKLTVMDKYYRRTCTSRVIRHCQSDWLACSYHKTEWQQSSAWPIKLPISTIGSVMWWWRRLRRIWSSTPFTSPWHWVTNLVKPMSVNG